MGKYKLANVLSNLHREAPTGGLAQKLRARAKKGDECGCAEEVPSYALRASERKLDLLLERLRENQILKFTWEHRKLWIMVLRTIMIFSFGLMM